MEDQLQISNFCPPISSRPPPRLPRRRINSGSRPIEATQIRTPKVRITREVVPPPLDIEEDKDSNPSASLLYNGLLSGTEGPKLKVELLSVSEPWRYSWSIIEAEAWKNLLILYENNQLYFRLKLEEGVSLKILESLLKLEVWFSTVIEPSPPYYTQASNFRNSNAKSEVEEWWDREIYKYRGHTWYCCHILRNFVAIPDKVLEELRNFHSRIREYTHRKYGTSAPKLEFCMPFRRSL